MMATKKKAEEIARKLRKENPNLIVRVKELSKGNWGVSYKKLNTRERRRRSNVAEQAVEGAIGIGLTSATIKHLGL
jgi:hypothetical protein